MINKQGVPGFTIVPEQTVVNSLDSNIQVGVCV
jgi:hypothetical protein